MMGYSAKILSDSLSPLGDRLTTFEITFPRIVLAEFNTHRMFSRNSASSRAIPVKKMLQRVLDDPFIPIYWGKNQPGMSAAVEVYRPELAEDIWLAALADSVYHVVELQLGMFQARSMIRSAIPYEKYSAWFGGGDDWGDLRIQHKLGAARLLIGEYNQPDPDDKFALNVHKQIANRLLEPWMWHTVIVTATEWSNFFALRTDASAQPEIRQIAGMMHELYHEHEPERLDYSDWHLPLVDTFELKRPIDPPQAISTGRCCRVSYLTHDGKRDPQKDVELHNSLLKNGHMSPFEHPARPMNKAEKAASPWSGNFYGWVQYRKTLENEADFSQARQGLEGSAWCEDCLTVHATREIYASEAAAADLQPDKPPNRIVIRKV